MKNFFRLPVVAALLSFAVAAHAQVTYTNANSVTGNTSVGAAVFTTVQTFTGFTSITDMTWQVVNTNGSAQTATFNAYIGQWDTSTNRLVGALTAFGTAGLSTGSVAGGATQNLTFTDTWTAPNSTLTYALLLSYASGATTFGANYSANPNDAFFGSGGTASVATSFTASGSNNTTLESNLQTVGGASPDSNFAYTMSVTGDLASTPEPKTAAAAFAALFVAGLVGRRAWQRRKPAAQLLAA